MVMPNVLEEAFAHWVNTYLSISLCAHLLMCLSGAILSFVLDCLSFINCRSGAEQTSDRASKEMTGESRRLCVCEFLCSCMRKGRPYKAKDGEWYGRGLFDKQMCSPIRRCRRAWWEELGHR